MSRRIRRLGPTPLLWTLLFSVLLVVVVCGIWTAVARAEEGERYTPSARGGRQAVQELAEASFAPEWVGWAVTTAKCESGWNLYAYSAGFDRRWGVFYAFWGALQVDSVTWGAKAYELFGGHLSDPSINFPMAAWILDHYGPSHWPYCGR